MSNESDGLVLVTQAISFLMLPDIAEKGFSFCRNAVSDGSTTHTFIFRVNYQSPKFIRMTHNYFILSSYAFTKFHARGETKFQITRSIVCHDSDSGIIFYYLYHIIFHIFGTLECFRFQTLPSSLHI